MTEFLIGLGLAAVSSVAYTLLRRTPTPKYLAHAEYWVYLPGETLPAQEAIMNRMLRGNPHRPGGINPITPAEGLLFSDVRLHIALVLRAKNPHVFRPDLFDVHVEPTADTLFALGESQSFVKIRFISEKPLADRRHLQFLPHAAGAIAALGQATVIYDVVADRLMLPQELDDVLDAARDLKTPEIQARAVWKRTPFGGAVETKGLAKVGLSEVETDEMNSDQQVLVLALLEGMISSVWELPALPPHVELSYFEDVYRVELRPQRRGPVRATLMKLPSPAVV